MRRAHEGVLAHRVDGAGEPLLLLNGIAMTIPSWEPVAKPLTDRFAIVRCDLRGQLMSPLPPPQSVTDHADDVAALLDHLALESVHVAGTSFGGIVGLLLAARFPERVRSLVTIASADGFDESMADEVARWRAACVQSIDSGDRGHLSDALEPVVYSPAFVDAHREQRAQRRSQIAALPRSWFEGLIGLLDSAHSLRLSEQLDAIRCPTLVVAAELDGFVPLARARGLADKVEGAEFATVEGAGHAVVVEKPDAVAVLIADFVGRHSDQE